MKTYLMAGITKNDGGGGCCIGSCSTDFNFDTESGTATSSGTASA